MNANRIINMVVRMFLRKAINSGMNAGMNALNKKDSAGRATPQDQRPNNNAPQQGVKQARRAARMARRMNKF
ncbi:hypothetical protein [Shimia sp. FJ5]|uniref:hypothetical protein n=1 Tax=Shimia sp. FJ5 TaxID=3079054 RepID=UPI002604DBDC|nr:hypothetical protein [Shimia sp. FJ5]MDV4144049.1 hypothetical protein [Shimia sp. FJ5]